MGAFIFLNVMIFMCYTIICVHVTVENLRFHSDNKSNLIAIFICNAENLWTCCPFLPKKSWKFNHPCGGIRCCGTKRQNKRTDSQKSSQKLRDIKKLFIILSLITLGSCRGQLRNSFIPKTNQLVSIIFYELDSFPMFHSDTYFWKWW